MAKGAVTDKKAVPSPDRLTVLAFKVLEEALTQAEDGPVQRRPGHRLALAWLASRKAGLDWHYHSFWEAMANTNEGGVRDGGTYIRTTQMHMLLCYWKRTLNYPY